MLHGTWDPPKPLIESASPVLAGGFFSTEPPGKPYFVHLLMRYFLSYPWILFTRISEIPKLRLEPVEISQAKSGERQWATALVGKGIIFDKRGFGELESWVCHKHKMRGRLFTKKRMGSRIRPRSPQKNLLCHVREIRL